MTQPTKRISTEQWTLGYCVLNVLASVMHRTNFIAVILLAVSAIWILSGRNVSPWRSILGIAVGLAAGILGLWRLNSGWAITLGMMDAVIAVALLQCHFSKFSFGQSALFLLRQSVRFETIYVILFGMTLALLPQFYKHNNMSTPGDVSMTALSTEVSPGMVTRLARSPRVAFTVKFKEGVRVKEDDLYWVGARLSQSNGLSWRQSSVKEQVLIPDPTRLDDEQVLHQSITANVSGIGLLAVLDQPVFVRSQDKGVMIGRDQHGNYVVEKAGKVSSIDFEAWSQLAPQGDPQWSADKERRYTQMSERASERVQELAKAVDIKPGDALVAAFSLMNYFREGDFKYSLNLGSGVSSVDDFLFKTRTGFCEHYAASFAHVMRSLNYPVRLVVGYQGGLWSRVTSGLIVRDQDAHVWVEVWSKSRQAWMRIDPTSAVAPDRIRLGSDSISEIAARPFFAQWLPILSVVYSEFAPDWTAIASAYDNRWLNSFLDQVFDLAANYFEMLLVLCGLALSYLLLKLLRYVVRAMQPDPMVSVYRDAVRLLKKKGISIESFDTVGAFCDRAARIFPEPQSRAIRMFAEQYNECKYGIAKPTSEDIRGLKKLLHAVSRPR